MVAGMAMPITCSGQVLVLWAKALVVLEGLPGRGEHVLAWLAPAFDEFDQQKERAEAERRADQVEQRAAGDPDLSHPGRGQHGAGRYDTE